MKTGFDFWKERLLEFPEKRQTSPDPCLCAPLLEEKPLSALLRRERSKTKIHAVEFIGNVFENLNLHIFCIRLYCSLLFNRAELDCHGFDYGSYGSYGSYLPIIKQRISPPFPRF